jgi:sensor histidine kinase YesM
VPQNAGSDFCWKEAVVTNVVAGLVAAFVIVWLNARWELRYVWPALVGGQVYAHAIGGLTQAAIVLGYPWLWRTTAVVRWPLLTLLLIATTAVGTLIGSFGMLAIGIVSPGSFWSAYWFSFRIGLLITFLFGFGAVAFDTLKARLDHATVRLREQELERERAQKSAAEARLSSLESRIHPHFLFNTLNSISALIRHDPQRAERLIERLAALLRFSLDCPQLGAVSFEDEMRIVAGYLEIEKARFGDRLRYSIDVPPDMARLEVPPLAIQTLVENSVKYAVAPRREGGTIRVSARRDGGAVVIEVWDDGAAFDLAQAPGGHGLDNLQSRLNTRYGGKAAVAVRPEQQGGKALVVTLPEQKLETAA